MFTGKSNQKPRRETLGKAGPGERSNEKYHPDAEEINRNAKQRFLIKEILDKGHDQNDFSTFMQKRWKSMNKGDSHLEEESSE